MKMLIRDSSVEYLESLKVRLEEQGIPAVIQGTETARMITSKVLFEPSLWVYVDQQFEDAAKLIKSPEHEVSAGIELEAFYENQPSKTELNSAVNRALIHMALYLVAFIIVVFVITSIF
jgi:ABC-type taurine transport system substrate-binding protein